MSYQVKLEAFEGPLDLLLHLIKKEEIDIYNIPIARITEEYLQYISLLNMLNLDIAGEFLVMAATLIHIKSRLLLPTVEPQAEGQEEADPRLELVQQLLEYKRFKETAKVLEERQQQQQKIYSRTIQAETGLEGEEYTIEVSLFELLEAFKKILAKTKSETREIIQEEIKVEEKMQEIMSKLSSQTWLNFEELFTDSTTKIELVTCFLALLELIKQKKVKITQTRLFSKIRITKAKALQGEVAPGLAGTETNSETNLVIQS